MSDIHITRELLRALERGELSERTLAEIELQHLESLCPFCRQEIRAWQEERRAAAAGRADALLTFPAVLARHAPDYEERRLAAELDLEALLAMPPAERSRRIERARSRFRGTMLAERLIRESRRRTPGDPREGYHFADLARLILLRSPGHPDTIHLLALASAQMANACRAEGDLRQADRHFVYVRHLVSHEGVTDLQVLAWIDHVEGSLRKDQRRFPQAESLLSRATMLFRISGDAVETARVLLTLGSLYFYWGLLDRAIEKVQTALSKLSPETEPRLYLNGRHNLALYLTESGRYEEAAVLFAEDEDLYRQFPEPWTQLRLSWLRGKIAVGLGDAVAAERFFVETRQGFLDQSIGYDVAMVSLDLAVLYVKDGRTAEVLRIAEEVVALFEAQDVHREALAALRLFLEAARREEVTAELALELASYLQAARSDPSLQPR